jgi:hypothetical protein
VEGERWRVLLHGTLACMQCSESRLLSSRWLGSCGDDLEFAARFSCHDAAEELFENTTSWKKNENRRRCSLIITKVVVLLRGNDALPSCKRSSTVAQPPQAILDRENDAGR